MHDYRRDFVGLFPDWLHHLSRERWRKIVGIHGMDRRNLLSDSGVARSAGVCDAAVSHFDACAGFSSPMGPPQADRALDDPNLALCLSHRCACLPDALQMVSAGDVTANLALGR